MPLSSKRSTAQQPAASPEYPRSISRGVCRKVTDRGILTERRRAGLPRAELPQAGLAPVPVRRGQSFNSYLCSHLRGACAPHARLSRVDAATRRSPPCSRPSRSGLRLVEREMLRSVGDEALRSATPTFTLAQWLEADGVDPEHPRVIDHRRHGRARHGQEGDRAGSCLAAPFAHIATTCRRPPPSWRDASARRRWLDVIVGLERLLRAVNQRKQRHDRVDYRGLMLLPASTSRSSHFWVADFQARVLAGSASRRWAQA